MNPHALRHMILSHARLPIPPHPQQAHDYTTGYCIAKPVCRLLILRVTFLYYLCRRSSKGSDINIHLNMTLRERILGGCDGYFTSEEYGRSRNNG